MTEKISRRQLVGVAAASVLTSAAARAQQPPPDSDVEKARASHRDNSATLAKFDIPQSTEPAFLFRA